MKRSLFFAGLVLSLVPCLFAEGWPRWRGHQQNGRANETLPTEIKPEAAAWKMDLKSRGTPVIWNDRIYVMGFKGEGTEMVELLVCADAKTGAVIWKKEFPDFTSDIIYDRYAISSPVLDGKAGRVYAMSSPGELVCYDLDGNEQWRKSLMEEFGRLTFPNGRTGAPILEGDLLIIHGITSNWGAQGPARDRFYAFDKTSGALVWSATPGEAPVDSSYSTPIVETRNGRRILYAGLGCGNVAAIEVGTGEVLWRFPTCKGGVNVSPVIAGDRIFSIHNLENLDSSETGRMIAIDLTAMPEKQPEGSPMLPASAELWRNPLAALSTSAVLGDGVVYQVTQTGELNAVDVATGEVKWKEKLGHEQLHASPLLANGILYVPMLNGEIHVFDVRETSPKKLGSWQFPGNILAAPSAWAGRLYLSTTEGVYAFGEMGEVPKIAVKDEIPAAGEATSLGIVPSEVILRPGETTDLKVFVLDRHGNRLREAGTVKWEKFVPPTARVRSEMDSSVSTSNVMTAGEKPSAGAWKASAGGLSGTMRGRVVAGKDYSEDFNSFERSEKHVTEESVQFAYPPLPWIGGRFKWEIRDREGEAVLAKTLDRALFQRATTFIGSPDTSGAIVEADILTEGTRRQMSSAGLINQRYIFALDGNKQVLEVSSNYDRLRFQVPFRWQADKWYRLKTAVQTNEDGSGVLRAKAWPRDEAEPDAWTMKQEVPRVHKVGTPGIFGFTPQNRNRVFIDNFKISPEQQTTASR